MSKKIAEAKRKVIVSIVLFIGVPIEVVNNYSRLAALEMTIGSLTSHVLAICVINPDDQGLQRFFESLDQDQS